MTVKLETVGDAIDYISANLARPGDAAEEIAVEGDLAKLSIHIEGENYHGSFPGEFARGLWEFQEAIYNAVAFSLYGVEDIRRLTAEQKDDFKIVFELQNGSLDIAAMLTTFFEKFAEGISKMDSKHKAITVATVALIIASAYGAVQVVEANADVKKAEVEAHLKIDQEHERTEQFRVITQAIAGNKVAAQFSKATEEGARSIVKRAQGATEVRVGAVTFDKDEIDEVNQRAAKEKASAQILTDEFVVVRVETRDSNMTKLILASAKTGEFSAIMQDEEFDADQINKLWSAIRNREKIQLEVNATYIRSNIRSAQIVKVL
ncbi:hypothetical protein [Paraburkholderia kirstenboschensis]|uniref:Uncharacterized protein n=1 Tax=Paraburkholderia kirstenboschensis TaxID=1245436 RepID=A0ABZ0EPP0_9BURK|nr:hypothetical protein [Paraburkholderia kirstenboschensis]WOD18665.1 hypothetical protein RW095_38865 [Paraburkholderia kirstenboschensis]